jgi:putative DNA methylase
MTPEAVERRVLALLRGSEEEPGARAGSCNQGEADVESASPVEVGCMATRKKLIEVVFPLESIEAASEREKSVRQGHPAQLHTWWGRHSLAFCRALLFTLLVDDPSGHPERFPTLEQQERERQRLLRMLESLLRWESTSNEELLSAVRVEIWNSCEGKPPPVHVLFSGAGELALEAQRLGLEVQASDSNKLATFLTKALIEIPGPLAGLPPVNPESDTSSGREWKGLRGLAEDLRYYGKVLKGKIDEQLAGLFPKVSVPGPEGAQEATVVAWLWARTVPCHACGGHTPLAKSFELATVEDKVVWAEPVPDRSSKRVRFEVREAEGPAPEGTLGNTAARCLICGARLPLPWIRQSGKAGNLQAQMMAMVADLGGRRHYLSPTPEHEALAAQVAPSIQLDSEIPEGPSSAALREFGLTKYEHLYTPRQRAALERMQASVLHCRLNVLETAASRKRDEFIGDSPWTDAISVYNACAISKMIPVHCTLATWDSERQRVRPALSGRRLEMTWTYAEANPLHDESGVERAVQVVASVLEHLPRPSRSGRAYLQADAGWLLWEPSPPFIVSPPLDRAVDHQVLEGLFSTWLKGALAPGLRESLWETLPETKPPRVLGFGEPTSITTKWLKELQFFLASALSEPGPHPLVIIWPEPEPHPDLLQELIDSGFELTALWPLDMIRGTREQGPTLLLIRPRAATADNLEREFFVKELRRELGTRWSQWTSIPLGLETRRALGRYLGAMVLSRHTQVKETDGTRLTVRGSLELGTQLASELPEGGHSMEPASIAPTEPASEYAASRITRVKVENFKSLVQCEVSLGSLMFLVGPNGAGKSNFLEALGFTAEALRTGSLPKPRGTEQLLHCGSPEQSDSFLLEFELNLSGGQRASYSLRVRVVAGSCQVQEESCRVEHPALPGRSSVFKVSGGQVIASVDFQPAPPHPERPYLQVFSRVAPFRAVYEALAAMVVYKPEPEKLRLPRPAGGPRELLLADGSNLPAVFTRLPEQARQQIKDFLAQIVPGVEGVERCELGPLETLQFYQRLSAEGPPQQFYAANMSDGTLRALAVLVALFQAEGMGQPRVSLVALEEPEVAVHPAALGLLRDALRLATRHTQVLVTSHSPDLLDDKELQAEQILAVSFEQGATHVNTIDEASRSILRDRLYTVGELLRANQLAPQPRTDPS